MIGSMSGCMSGAIGVVSSSNNEYRLFFPALAGAPGVCTEAIYTNYREGEESFWVQGPADENGYAFQIEMSFRAMRKGFKPVEIPIVFADRTPARPILYTELRPTDPRTFWQIRVRKTF